MADPFVAEIRIFPFNFAPKGWAFCNGQLLPISQNTALFSLLGTTYGGNGQTNFALPNLRGQVPIHVGDGHTLGERAGQSAHTLTINEMPQHLHLLNAANVPATTNLASSNVVLAQSTASQLYNNPTNLTPMDPTGVTNVGGSQAHENRMPFLTLSFCIALQGIFPSPN
jgi:microcystin-dependent protein